VAKRRISKILKTGVVQKKKTVEELVSYVNMVTPFFFTWRGGWKGVRGDWGVVVVVGEYGIVMFYSVHTNAQGK
jgi:hypothetical protein